jgi:predicted AAA+ superfamily ATPase
MSCPNGSSSFAVWSIGGFPEVQDLDSEARRRILRDYIDVVLFRDVVERHGISNTAALRYMVRSLLSSPGGLFSIHRMYNDLKSQGVRVSKDTLHAYLAHLEDAFLLFTLPIAKKSERARMVNPRKCYPVDPALARTLSLNASKETRHLLENIVYLELKRRDWTLGYLTTHSGRDVDFLAQRVGDQPLLVQVCADMSEVPTRERELRAISDALNEHAEARAVVVTLDEEEQITWATTWSRSFLPGAGSWRKCQHVFGLGARPLDTGPGRQALVRPAMGAQPSPSMGEQRRGPTVQHSRMKGRMCALCEQESDEEPLRSW